MHVEVAIVNNVVTLTLDTSGVGLQCCGYRDAILEMLRETMAGLVLLKASGGWGQCWWIRSAWERHDPDRGGDDRTIDRAGLNRSFDAERWMGSDGKL